MSPHEGAGVTARGFGWRHAGRKKPALSDVDFRINPGERVLLLGESGAGKSTLLAAIAGVLGGEDEGDWFGSLKVAGSDARDVAATRGKVGMLLQDPDAQVIASRVGDDVAFGCENLGVDREEIWRRVPEALALVGLQLPLDHPTAELSGGQKQRLALAGIIAMGAQIIVLDEPTANLDPIGVQEVRAAIARITAETGATLIVVEHRVETWQGITDRAIVLSSSGGLLADGPLAQVLPEQGKHLAAHGIWVPEEFVAPEQRIELSGRRPVATESALSAENLSTGWARPIGQPHTLRLPAGNSTVITGPNGSGKSTLALTLAGLLPPLGGTIRAAGQSGLPHTWRSAKLATQIGFVFQDPEHQFLSTSVLDELLVAPRVLAAQSRRRWPWQPAPDAADVDKQRAMELLERLRLEHLAAANPFTLSGGQKRRLSVATALISSPGIVILDEPTFGQDRRTFLDVVTLLRELTDTGVSVAAITHDELFISLLGDHRIEVGVS
ncbi:ATP-binding cassette domain-containing protein [Corynebacterium sp. H127]|uniref:ABC transporter ATP-binding protein n=1 Tax=Corynebacterium sp. H127 TaxID=3133418 RepID=UPI00309AD19A